MAIVRNVDYQEFLEQLLKRFPNSEPIRRAYDLLMLQEVLDSKPSWMNLLS